MQIVNRKAKFNYELLDRIEVGIVLSGAEVKSVKAGHLSFSDAFVKFIGSELWLVNMMISPYAFAQNENYDPKQSRKLLLHKQELLALTKKMETGNLTLVPTVIYTKGRRVKLEIALARGRKTFEKKEVLKRRDLDREAAKTLRGVK